MTKNELAKEVAASEKLTMSTAVKAVDGVIRVIKETLAKGEPIFIRGFGTLSVVTREARHGHDFRTGETITIAAKRVVRLKPSTELSNLINK